MPRFVADAVGVVAGVGEVKAEGAGVLAEPAEFTGPGEGGFEPEIRRRAKIEGATRVMFTAAGGGNETQDLADGFAGGEFCPDDFDLPGHAAEAGEWEQRYAIARGRSLHFGPRGGGTRREPNRLAVVGRRAD